MQREGFFDVVVRRFHLALKQAQARGHVVRLHAHRAPLDALLHLGVRLRQLLGVEQQQSQQAFVSRRGGAAAQQAGQVVQRTRGLAGGVEGAYQHPEPVARQAWLAQQLLQVIHAFAGLAGTLEDPQEAACGVRRGPGGHEGAVHFARPLHLALGQQAQGAQRGGQGRVRRQCRGPLCQFERALQVAAGMVLAGQVQQQAQVRRILADERFEAFHSRRGAAGDGRRARRRCFLLSAWLPRHGQASLPDGPSCLREAAVSRVRGAPCACAW